MKSLSFDFPTAVSQEEENLYYRELEKFQPQFYASLNHRERPQQKFLFLRDENKNLIGGSNFFIDYDFLNIERIWVARNFQRHGLGARLFLELETYAKTQGCRRILLSTFEFQDALRTWQKWGFQIVGEVADCPQGSRLYYLNKTL